MRNNFNGKTTILHYTRDRLYYTRESYTRSNLCVIVLEMRLSYLHIKQGQCVAKLKWSIGNENNIKALHSSFLEESF